MFIRLCIATVVDSPGYIIHIYRRINIYTDRFHALWVIVINGWNSSGCTCFKIKIAISMLLVEWEFCV